MNKSPQISIITINYNDTQGLKKTMESVFTQTFSDYEYIIIDGEVPIQANNIYPANKINYHIGALKKTRVFIMQ